MSDEKELGKLCPACGKNSVASGSPYCSMQNPVWELRWWYVIPYLKRCNRHSKFEEHLHRRCLLCAYRWIVRPLYLLKDS